MRRCLGLLIFVSLLGQCFAQSPPTGRVRRADKKFDRYAYFKALEKYRKAYEKDNTNPHIILRIADCYRLMSEPEEAEPWYREALFYPENAEETINYLHFIRTLMENGKYEDAGKVVANYLERWPGDQLGMAYAESCRSYPVYYKDSSTTRVANLKVNSPESDFGPAIFEDELIFSSGREEERLLFGWNGRYFLQLYSGQIEENGFEVEELNLFRGVNTKFHEAIVTFTPDAETMYFTRNNYYKGRRGLNVNGATLLKIYRADKEGENEWGDVEPVHFNSDEYSVGHPTLSPDGQILYFTSDQPGGYGGTDIYMVKWEGEDWGQPINMGAEINTPAEEMFPWVSPENILYFASDGHPGLGGLDLYMSDMNESAPTVPQNLGAPFNSNRDDFHYVERSGGRSGYFSSNRPNGVGSDDIYSWGKRPQVYQGIVVDKITQEPIEGASVQFVDGDKMRYFNFSGPTGLFELGMDSLYPWEAIVAKEGYEVERRPLEDAEASESGLVAKFELVRCGEGPAETPEDTGKVILSGIIRDDDGQPIQKGKVRIIREIEVEDSEFVTELEPGVNYIVEVEPTEYPFKPKVYDITTNRDQFQNIPLEAIFGRDELPPGRTFYIIYYDFDSSAIRPRDAEPELDRLVSFMKRYEEVNVELNSHTDSRGSHPYNENLSRRRAQEAIAYIVKHGIDRNRLSFNYYGERALATPCPNGVECSEEEHQLNRRTEFKIKSWKNGWRSWEK